MTRWIGVLAVVAACGGGGGDDDGAGDPDAGGGDVDAAVACERMPSPDADAVRHGVVSFPYAASQMPASTYEVFTLDASGAITLGGASFEMGRSTIGTIVFTPDGELGFVAQEDGSLGVFRLAGDSVEVLHARFEGDFYAEKLVMSADGATLYVIDPNTRNNGGGVYRVGIGCDDTITDLGLWIPTRSAGGLVFAGPETLVAAREAGASSPAGDDVHAFVTSEAAPMRVGGTDAFGDDEAIISGTALTSDGIYMLIGDSQQISKTPPNRVAVVAMGDVNVQAVQVLSPIEDPLSIVTSPFDNTALVVSGFGDAFITLEYAASATTPFTVRGPITYTGARPELPGTAVMIDRGALRGLVLVPENLGIRRLQFAAGGTITDLGKTATGASGFENITGALGIQP
jgi:hypothetical protein